VSRRALRIADPATLGRPPYTSVRSEIARASSTSTRSPAASAVVIFSLMSNGQDSFLGLVVDLKEGYVSCGPEWDHKLT